MPAAERSTAEQESTLRREIAARVQELRQLDAPQPPEKRTPKGKKNTEKPADFAAKIDHTLLRPDATLEQILTLCQEARSHGLAAVCVHGHWLPEVVQALKGSKTLPICVVGFPHGGTQPKAKAAETRMAVKAGAREIDMVINVGRIKSRHWSFVLNDIRGVVKAAGKRPVKVILETSLLSDEEKAIAAVLAELAGAAFVKTSTGFGGGGATLEDIRLLRRVVGPRVRLKASGGIKSRAFADALISAGADRIGTSSGPALVTDQPQPQEGY